MRQREFITLIGSATVRQCRQSERQPDESGGAGRRAGAPPGVIGMLVTHNRAGLR